MQYEISRTVRCGRFFCIYKGPDENSARLLVVRKWKPKNAQSLAYQWVARFRWLKPQKNFCRISHNFYFKFYSDYTTNAKKKHPKCTVRLFHFLNREFRGIAHFLTELTSKKLDVMFFPVSLLLANWEEKVLLRQRFGCGCQWRTLKSF